MRRKTLGWLIAASVLIVLGGTLFVGAMSACDWDFNRLNSSKYETNTHTPTEDFENVLIDIKNAKVMLLPSENEGCKVICHERDRMLHTVTVEDGTLKIKTVDSRQWYDYIAWFESAIITVYLPKGEYDSLKITGATGDIGIDSNFKFSEMKITTTTGDIISKAAVAERADLTATTGDIRIENTEIGSLTASVSTGSVTVKNLICHGNLEITVSTGFALAENVTCRDFTSQGATGDLYMKNLTAEGNLSAARSTGDITFEKSDARSISVTCTTGSIGGTLRSAKAFIASAATGSVTLPESTAGAGKCELHTTTGNISISIAE